MRVGVSLLFQAGNSSLPDKEVMDGDLRVALLAEELGFDYVSAVEHHFSPYAMVPDNFQILSWIAARTSRIELQLGVVVLPWHDPLRAAEKLVLLDHLSDGRVALGVGRGLSRREYDGMRIDMTESRERFSEAVNLLLDATDSGIAQGDGPFYPQPAVPLRPAPLRPFRDRFFSVAMSPDSATATAELGAAMMVFIQTSIEDHAPAIEAYRERYREVHETEPPPVVLSELTHCNADPDAGAAMMKKYNTRQFEMFVEHYEMEKVAKTKGYESYQAAADGIKAAGTEAAVGALNDALAWGTPEQIVEKWRHRVDVIGSAQATVNFAFGGMPYDKVEASMRLFASEVLPQLKELEVMAAR